MIFDFDFYLIQKRNENKIDHNQEENRRETQDLELTFFCSNKTTSNSLSLKVFNDDIEKNVFKIDKFKWVKFKKSLWIFLMGNFYEPATKKE